MQFLDGILAVLSGAAMRLRPHLDRAWRRAAALAAALGGAAAGLWARLAARRPRAARSAAPAAPVARLGADRQWEIVMGIAAREVARASAIAAFQVRAAVKIDAAEHALARILADCAKVLPAAAAPAAQPEPAPQTSRPLAA